MNVSEILYKAEAIAAASVAVGTIRWVDYHVSNDYAEEMINQARSLHFPCSGALCDEGPSSNYRSTLCSVFVT